VENLRSDPVPALKLKNFLSQINRQGEILVACETFCRNIEKRNKSLFSKKEERAP